MTHPDKVITESQRIAEALEKIAHEYGYFMGLAYEDTDGNLAAYEQGRAIKEMSKWVMDYAHTEWSKNVRHGVSLGRSDAVAMLQSINPTMQDIWPDKLDSYEDMIKMHEWYQNELQKVITALEGTA